MAGSIAPPQGYGTLALLTLALTTGCGGRDEPRSVRNDSERQAAQIANQAQALSREAENATSAIEQAMENEGAVLFEDRERLLNETADEAAEDTVAQVENAIASTGNRSEQEKAETVVEERRD